MARKWQVCSQIVELIGEAARFAKEDDSSCILEWHLMLSLLRFESVWQQVQDQESLQKKLFIYAKRYSDKLGDKAREPELPQELKHAFFKEAERLRAEAKVSIPMPAHLAQALFTVGSDQLRKVMVKHDYANAVARKDEEHEETHEKDPEKDPERREEALRHRRRGMSSHDLPETDAEALQTYTVELVSRAREKKSWAISGREQETDAIIRSLLRRQKCCPVLVGRAGVGKTSVVEALAQRIVAGQVPESMRDATIYSLDSGALIGGAAFRGEYEGRLRCVVEAVKHKPGAILFVDELHALMTSGTNHGDAMTVGNILKPELASGALKFIGATTEDEYQKFIETDAAMARRFTEIVVSEPSHDACLQMLLNCQTSLEDFYKIRLSRELFDSALDLVETYIPQRCLPDKVFDVIEEAAADQLLRERQGEELPQECLEEAVARVARLSHLPRQKDDQLNSLRALEAELKKHVFGQDEAVSCLSDAVKLAETGFSFAARGTRGAFFFNGPTGVGKTEIARQLAQSLNLKLVKFDMSEYATELSVAKFIGSAPGYVGYEEGGLLVNAIRETPNCVLLLDEIEKAHPAVHRLLLQVMDAGTLTDSRGRTADFRHVYLIMTGNVRICHSNPVGFGVTEACSEEPAEPDLAGSFAPEFRSRLTASVQFKSLDFDALKRIVEAKFERLRRQAAQKGFTISLDESARNELVRRTLDRHEGARPIDPLLAKVAGVPLVNRILSGKQPVSSSLLFKNSAFMYA